jgi:replication factor A1
MKVRDVRPRAAVDTISLEIVSKAEARAFATEKGSGRVCNAAGKDDTGEIQITLWNEQIEQVNEGDKITIENGWASEYKGQTQLSTGKLGKLTVQK